MLTIITLSNFLVKFELKYFHGSSLSLFIAKTFQLRSFHGSTNRHFIVFFFEKPNFYFFSCIFTYKSRTVARQNSFAPEQFNLRISWKTAKSLKNFVKSQAKELLQLDYITILSDSMKPASF